MVRRQSPALAALRAATATAHVALENALEIGRDAADEGAYARYLQAVLGWIDPLERCLWSAPWPAPVEPLARARKTSWIESDLRARGLNDHAISQLPRYTTLPPMPTLAHRFGVAYVVEGAQLGGRSLLRRLGPRIAPLPARWLEGYGHDTSGLWSSFLDALAANVRDRVDVEAAAHNARLTFELAHTWFTARSVA